MIYFITGHIGCGKSTKLLSMYQSLSIGDGFYNIRRYNGNQTIGQDIVHVSTGNYIPFSRIDGFIPRHWHEAGRYRNYSFSKDGLAFTNKIIQQLLDTNETIAYIDELGHLELKKEGLYHQFNALLQANFDIYVVCRNNCLNAIIDLYNISEFTIINC